MPLAALPRRALAPARRSAGFLLAIERVAIILLATIGPSSALAQGPAPPTPVPAPAAGTDEAGLYVIIEAAQRPLDAMLVLPVQCALPRASCDTLDQVLANDTRLSGVVRLLKGTSAQAGQIGKTPWPTYTVRPAAAQSMGATYVLAAQARPSKQAGLIELIAVAFDARDGKPLDLLEYAHQVGPGTGLRSMAHRVLNAVHGTLTGVEGSFDTVIYYAAAAPALQCSRAIWAMDADGFNRRVLVADGGLKNGIHMFPMQLVDGGLAYMSFRSEMPSLYKMEAAQLNALIDLVPALPKGARMMKAGETATTGSDFTGPPVPFAKGSIDMQFRGCAQNGRGDFVATVNDGDQADIWAVDGTGYPHRNLTNTENDDLGPTFSPDGTHIAFVSDRTGTPQVFVMDWDGQNARRLTFAGPYNTDPDWGPDGRIAYSGMRGDALDVLTVDLAGKMQRLTPGQGRRSLEPSWAPDGKRLVYCSNEDGTRKLRLWIASHDGAVREPLDVPLGDYFTPSWQRMQGQQARRWARKVAPQGP
ncbi:MAG: hypothetical protein EXR79_04110 [Myxococcales bacterium]|nr:hypothetical protein [Myxococcales bacterium]